VDGGLDLNWFARQGIYTLAIDACGQAMSSFITASGVTDAAVWDNSMVRASGETRNGARRHVGLVRAVDIIEYLLWSGHALASQTTSTNSIGKERCVDMLATQVVSHEPSILR
jgi:hypothetical protein